MYRIIQIFTVLLVLVVNTIPAFALSRSECLEIEQTYGFLPELCQPTSAINVVYSGNVSENLTQRQIENHIFFPEGGSELSARARAQIALIAGFLQQAPLENACLQLVGHSDTSGSSEANEKIASERVNVVGQALQGHSLAAARIVALVGKGETAPLLNLAPTSKWQRRVEIRARNCRGTSF